LPLLFFLSPRFSAISAREKICLSQRALRVAEGGFFEHFVLWEKEQEWILLFFFSAILRDLRERKDLPLAEGAEGR
jgi:hypothetical protein